MSSSRYAQKEVSTQQALERRQNDNDDDDLLSQQEADENDYWKSRIAHDTEKQQRIQDARYGSSDGVRCAKKCNRCGDELLVDDDDNDRRANCDSCREKMRVRKANSRARTMTTTMAARDSNGTDDFLSLVDDSDIVGNGVRGSNRRNSNRGGMFLSARIGERNINPSSTSAKSSQLRAYGEEQRLRLT